MQMVTYIANNIHNINFENEIVLSGWSFIKEDYNVIQDLLDRFDERF